MIRGTWEGANPSKWLDSKTERCEICGRKEELRAIHYLGAYRLEEDHLMICRHCFDNDNILPDWYGCGCGG